MIYMLFISSSIVNDQCFPDQKIVAKLCYSGEAYQSETYQHQKYALNCIHCKSLYCRHVALSGRLNPKAEMADLFLTASAPS